MIKKKIDKKWKIYFREQSEQKVDILNLDNENLQSIVGTVPGNVELDLIKAGLLPQDLYMGCNILKAEEFEEHEWWYATEFEAEVKDKMLLRFEGVDCLAEYFLNGEKIGESDNAMIPHEFDVSNKIKENNKLVVHIFSSKICCDNAENDIYSLINTDDLKPESLTLRKPAHAFGWDIMPRAMSAGLWKDVYLCEVKKHEIKDIFCTVMNLESQKVTIRGVVNFGGKIPKGAELEIFGKCGESEFSFRKNIYYHAEFMCFEIENPMLWWPYGYGDANLYDCKIKLLHEGKTLAQKDFRMGIRTVKLQRTETTACDNPHFYFEINGARVMCKGTNWVPMDAYHSRDKERYPKAFELMKEIGCNMVRCWGGNVYEQKEFYDFCDENGIMIWQDFSMACHAYPQNNDFCNKIKKEAEVVIRERRMHPSIVLWSGDNEVDEIVFRSGTDPNGNILTRHVLKEAVRLNDCNRPYLPSSPYISPEVAAGRGKAPEQHLWGPRDYFKSEYYLTSDAKFISEVGYHGCPNMKSVEKFIEKDYMWPIENNPQWTLHSSDQKGDEKRVILMKNQIQQLFGKVPDNLEDFIICSQISQAEADKFFIEHIRCNKKETGGILWWNLVDGWPQFSDAVVDYYYEKKLAFDYIKRSQAPFVIMADEPQNWHINIIASNDTLKDVSGTFKVYDIDTEEIYAEGNLKVGINGIETIASVPYMYSDKKMIIIEWEVDGLKSFNHYLCGSPAFDFEKYKEWIKKIKAIAQRTNLK